jgi:hypothetical protein
LNYKKYSFGKYKTVSHNLDINQYGSNFIKKEKERKIEEENAAKSKPLTKTTSSSFPCKN